LSLMNEAIKNFGTQEGIKTVVTIRLIEE
jgi:hypothetical protein